MEKIKKSVIRTSIIILVNLWIVGSLKAQPNPGPGNQGSNISVTNDGPTVPFDGGMSIILLASGIWYGARKFRRLTLVNWD